jgi:hypothetical protein
MTTKGQVTNAFPAWRIFIFGQEVTEDVTSCHVTHNDGRSPNSAEVTLLSPGDRYVVTAQDIEALYNNVTLKDLAADGAYQLVSWNSDRSMRMQNITPDQVAAFSSKTREVIQDKITDQIKEDVILAKFDKSVQVNQPKLGDLGYENSINIDIKTAKELSGEAFRYPFQEGDCIFHSSDAVRIFWRDPFNPKQWHHMFAGFVTDWSEESTADHASTVKIRFEDASRVLRHARISLQPGFYDIEALAVQAIDAVIRTVWADGFSRLSLTELLFTLLFGVQTAGTEAKTGTTSSSGENEKGVDKKIKPATAWTDSRYGVHAPEGVEYSAHDDALGAFSYSRSQIYYYGLEGVPAEGTEDKLPTELQERVEKINSDELDVYLRDPRVRTEVMPSDLEWLKLDGSTGDSLDLPTDLVAQQNFIMKELGEHPELYPVDGGGLVMLLPSSLGPEVNKTLLMNDIATDFAGTRTKWMTRLGIIYDMIQRIDFSFHVSPKGHLLCEMPLYDFSPLTNLPDRTDGEREYVVQKGEGNTFDDTVLDLPPVSATLIVPESRIISWTRSFSEENVKTLMSTPWYIAKNWLATGLSIDAAQPPSITLLRSLVPQFGVRAETVKPEGYIASEAAAQVFGNVKLRQLNSNVRTANVSIIPRLGILPNRPIYFGARNFIGCSRSIKHELTWNSSMTMSIDVNYLRGWDGQTNEGKQMIHTEIGGVATAGGLNYASMHKAGLPVASSKPRKK